MHFIKKYVLAFKNSSPFYHTNYYIKSNFLTKWSLSLVVHRDASLAPRGIFHLIWSVLEAHTLGLCINLKCDRVATVALVAGHPVTKLQELTMMSSCWHVSSLRILNWNTLLRRVRTRTCVFKTEIRFAFRNVFNVLQKWRNFHY